MLIFQGVSHGVGVDVVGFVVFLVVQEHIIILYDENRLHFCRLDLSLFQTPY